MFILNINVYRHPMLNDRSINTKKYNQAVWKWHSDNSDKAKKNENREREGGEREKVREREREREMNDYSLIKKEDKWKKKRNISLLVHENSKCIRSCLL